MLEEKRLISKVIYLFNTNEIRFIKLDKKILKLINPHS